MALCECGCGKDAGVYSANGDGTVIRKGAPRRFINGHNRRSRESAEVRRARRIRTEKRIKLRTMYGLALEDYERMVEEQDGRCAICREPCPSGRMLAVDHDHETGAVRGLLCCNCNRGMGLLAENPVRAMALVEYLGRHLSA